MEADWAVEVGPDLPSIVVPWDGFVALRSNPSLLVRKIFEANSNPPLCEALTQLNANPSPLLTSKCDVWQLNPEKVDPDEFGSRPEDARCGFASYIDILLIDPERFPFFECHEAMVRRLTERLRAHELANCRVDLVVRSAMVRTTSGYGVTLYAAGCGADQPTAYAAWRSVLHAAVNATINMAHLPSARASSSIG